MEINNIQQKGIIMIIYFVFKGDRQRRAVLLFFPFPSGRKASFMIIIVHTYISLYIFFSFPFHWMFPYYICAYIYIVVT